MTAGDAIQLEAGGAELLPRIEALWRQLREHHAGLSDQWRDSLLAADFGKRCEELLGKSAGGAVSVILATTVKTAQDAQDIGYCVSTVGADGAGEVDSIFVTAKFRRIGVGDTLMAAAMDWLASRNADPIHVDVLAGNDAALRFYERHGFRARTARLRFVATRDGG
jgi:ribosomal protein S18 acetylase RimI-like enzyme